MQWNFNNVFVYISSNCFLFTFSFCLFWPEFLFTLQQFINYLVFLNSAPSSLRCSPIFDLPIRHSVPVSSPKKFSDH